MSANNLDRQPEERLLTEIKDLKRQLSEMRTLQQQGSDALGLIRSDRYTSSITLGAGLAGYLGFFIWFVDAEDRQFLGIPEFTLYQDDATLSDDSKVIGSGLNNYMDKYRITWWPNELASSADGLYYWIHIVNQDTVAHTVYLAARARWLVTQSVLSTF